MRSLLLTFTMKYLYTDNATQEYKGKGREYYKFQAVQTTHGWIGVLQCSEALAKELIEENPRNIREVDEQFYNEIIKKERESKSPNNPSLYGSDETSTRRVQRKSGGCGVCGS